MKERSARSGRKTIAALGQALATGETTSTALVRACLERAAEPAGEGSRVYLRLNADHALQAAADIDRRLANGQEGRPLAGIPISVKDLFDIEGQVTRSGSLALQDNPPASSDAVAVARLKAAGLVVLGSTNMTEFAYSGLGLNPHFGTPRNSWRRLAGHVPGGSSSGAAISVTDEMAHAGIGTDTGGSCRIPAAFTGLVGFKPTASSIPKDGVHLLAPTLDSVGPIARSVNCCGQLWRIMAGRHNVNDISELQRPIRLVIPQTVVLDDLDRDVRRDFENTVERLTRGGLTIVERPLQFLADIVAANAGGGFPAMESYELYADLIASAGSQIDRRVLARMLRGRQFGETERRSLIAVRAAAIRAFVRELNGFDAALMPTVAVVPPRIDDLASDDAYDRANMLALRNTSLINFVDGCAVSIPMHAPGKPPTGLMLARPYNGDDALLAIAEIIEQLQ